MAEELGDEEKSGGGGLLRLILPVIALLIGAGVGYVVGTSFTEKNYEDAALLDPGAEPGRQTRDVSAIVGDIYELDPFVVNLNEPRGNRYLKVTIQMELAMDSPELLPELERRKGQLRDTILGLLTSKSSKDLQLLEGKFRLREELISRVNSMLVNGRITRIYFTEFVIQ